MAKNFSDTYIRNLKPLEKRYQVREAKGFTLRVMPSGTKTFLFIYEVNGVRKQLTLGDYPTVSLADAREKYRNALEALATGEPLIPEIPKEAEKKLTFGEVAEEYLKSCSGQSKTWLEAKKVNIEVKAAAWKDRDVDSITKREAVKLIEDDRRNGNGSARTLYNVLHAMFEYAIGADHITASPFERVKKVIPAIRPKSRKVFLDTHEIPIVWNNILRGNGTSSTRRALLLILVTAQRPGEVTGMHSREIQGDWWTIPACRAMKGNRDHRVFLTKTAKELIGDIEGYKFPSGSATGHLGRNTLAKIVDSENCYGLEKRWTPHDLRRTVRTHLPRLKVPTEHSEAVINHAKEGMDAVYNQYEYDTEKMEALQLWEAELLRLIAQAKTSE